MQAGSKSHEAKQVEEHQHNVVMLLQSKLADISLAFKDVLEIRTQVRRFKPTRQRAYQACSTEYERVEGPYRAVHALHVSRSKSGTLK